MEKSNGPTDITSAKSISAILNCYLNGDVHKSKGIVKTMENSVMLNNASNEYIRWFMLVFQFKVMNNLTIRCENRCKAGFTIEHKTTRKDYQTMLAA